MLFVGMASTATCLAARPNVIFFMADDLGYGDAGPFKQANSPIPTPNVDRLATEGMTFTDAHTAAAVCAPSRYAMLTGNYPYRGHTRWGTWAFNRTSQFLPGQKTVGDVMKAAGYRTAFFGKYHQGGDFYAKGSNTFYRDADASRVDFTRAFRNGPVDHGFGYSFVAPTGIQNQPYAFFENDTFLPLNPAQPNMVYWPAGRTGDSVILAAGYGDANWDSSRFGPIQTQKALDFIDRHHQENLREGTNVPFLMYYSSQTIHGPNTPPNFFLDGTRVKGATGTDAKGDMIYEMDLQVGALLRALDQRGLTRNTIFIFTSDNGGLPDSIPNHDSRGGLRGSKTLLYEGGHRVPFIVRWGDGTTGGSTIRPGSRSNQLVANHDWVAMLYELTEQAMPDDQARDSVSILPVLLGRQSESTPLRDYLVLQAGNWGDQNQWQGIRRSNMMLILDAANEPRELYDIAADLRQTRNLIADPRYTATVNEMHLLNHAAVDTMPRTVPPWRPGGGGTEPNPCGAPTNYNPAVDSGVFLWKNCTTGTWQLRAAAGGASGRHAGVIASSRALTSVTRYSIESSDVVDTSNPTRIAFTLNMASPWDDGFNFTFSGDAQVQLTMSTPSTVRVGVGRTAVTLPYVLGEGSAPPPIDPCGTPSYDAATDVGIFVWQDCATGLWRMRAVAGGTFGEYVGRLTSDQAFTRVTSYNIEAGDIVNTSVPTQVGFDFHMWSPWVDGLDFTFPSSANVTLLMESPTPVFYGGSRTRVTLPLALIPGN